MTDPPKLHNTACVELKCTGLSVPPSDLCESSRYRRALTLGSHEYYNHCLWPTQPPIEKPRTSMIRKPQELSKSLTLIPLAPPLLLTPPPPLPKPLRSAFSISSAAVASWSSGCGARAGLVSAECGAEDVDPYGGYAPPLWRDPETVGDVIDDVVP